MILFALFLIFCGIHTKKTRGLRLTQSPLSHQIKNRFDDRHKNGGWLMTSTATSIMDHLVLLSREVFLLGSNQNAPGRDFHYRTTKHCPRIFFLPKHVFISILGSSLPVLGLFPRCTCSQWVACTQKNVKHD